LSFHQLDRHDMAPIRYKRVNGKTVERKDIARGYEHAPGEFVLIDDEELAAANVEATQAIDLEEFVDPKTIPAAYFERPYYLAPGKRADKAYALFRDALERKRVVAVGTIVIRTRQHLCAILAQKDVLTLEILRFAHELRGLEGLHLPSSLPVISWRAVAAIPGRIFSPRSSASPPSSISSSPAGRSAEPNA
ncbi:MAG: Ku protein, partial [Minicystis sp.]